MPPQTDSPATPVPWEVAEAVAGAVARLQPRRIAIVGDADGRLAQAIAEASDALCLGIQQCDVDDLHPVDCLVWTPGTPMPTAAARRSLLAVAGRALGDIIVCEMVAPGQGLGDRLLAAVDPDRTRVRCGVKTDDEEAPVDAHGATCLLRAVEPDSQWVVATAAAWRFLPDAELARDGFVRRLQRLAPAEIVMTCRRIRSRFDTAHELVVLGMEELARRGDDFGLAQLQRELSVLCDTPPSVRARAHTILIARRAAQDEAAYGLAV